MTVLQGHNVSHGVAAHSGPVTQELVPFDQVDTKPELLYMLQREEGAGDVQPPS